MTVSSTGSKTPDFMVNIKNAASKFISNLKTTGDVGATSYGKGLSGDDLSKARSIFSAELLSEYDKANGNGDGELTVEEYGSAYASAMKEYMTTIGAMSIETGDLNFDGTVDASDKDYKDQDGDGDVDKDDQAAFEKMTNTANTQQGLTVANNIDANDDGVISVEEMALITKIKDGNDSTGKNSTFDGAFSSEANDSAELWLTGKNVDMKPYASDLKTNTTNANVFLKSFEETDSSNTTASLENNDVVVKTSVPTKTVVPKKTIEQKKVVEPDKTATIRAWGSKPEKGQKYANDCLSRVIANNYPEVKLYSKEYKEVLNKIMDSNDIKNPNKIPTGTKLILP